MTKMLKIILVAVFILSFGLLVFSARANSQTTDEAIHLFAGYTYLSQGDFRLDPEHPPFLKELSALPLIFVKNIQIKYDDLWQNAGVFYYDSWKEARILGDDFFYNWGNNPDQLLFLGRLVTIFLTLILGYFAYFWAKKLYGPKAGVMASFLVLFFPNILAHGQLVNTDLGLTLFIFIAVYFWGEYLKKMSYLSLALTGLFCGLAMASKFTAIMLFVILFILALVKFIMERKNLGKIVGGYILILAMTFIVVWASYGFSFAVPPKPAVSLSNELTNWVKHNVPDTHDSLFEQVRPLMAPDYFYKGFAMVTRHAVGGHGSYLLGMNSNTGWWYYFPVTILFKTPIPIFILLGLVIVYRKKLKAKDLSIKNDDFDELLLILPPIIYLAFAMYSKADLGIRHILPIFPFVLTYIAKTANLVDFKKFKIPTIIIAVSLVWYLFSAFIIYPNYIAYFNELSGGPKNGHKILTDSNLDWGQDIFRIKKYMDENHLDHVYLVYPWDGDRALNYYGINFTPLLPDDRVFKGKAVISATYYETDVYDWLKQYPMEQITPGVFLVDIN